MCVIHVSVRVGFSSRRFEPIHEIGNDNTWIGLHDAEPEFNSLGANGFVWDTCIPLSPGAWTNWAQDEPAQRYNNWCVRMSLGELQWQPEQCTSSAHFLCQQNLGPCGAFKNSTAGCDTASLSYTFVALSVQLTWDECLRRCMFYSNGSDSCWMFKYEADAARCSLAVGAEPVYCADSGSSSTSGSSYWVRQCYSLTYDQTHTFNVQPNYDAFPVDYCGAMTTMISTVDPAEVTQQIVQELSVDKRHLSSTRRKLTCAIDNRPTAKATGGLGADVMHTWRRLETVAGSQIRRSAS
nr:hypothetical protein BaRGS_016433 [Batillaria attramentaria]